MSDPILNDAKGRIIVALDVDSPETAMGTVKSLAGEVGMFKVGVPLFSRDGPELIKKIQRAGFDVFLDLKFYDLPSIVAQSVRRAAELRVKFCTVHATGGVEMLDAAVDAAEKTDTTVLAVTVLTSMNDADLIPFGFPPGTTTKELVLHLARLATYSEVGGIVCSGEEVSEVSKIVRACTTLVTPGIRFPGEGRDDQKRVVMPYEAIRNGADYLVIGRPITRATDPVAAARKFANAIAMEMVEMSR